MEVNCDGYGNGQRYKLLVGYNTKSGMTINDNDPKRKK